ncbi:MAG: hypothetical protein EAY70_13160 [Sphingomonadales bacterium]|nr:MAG: hypothetical protein EAY70_13160 [Sphingomonadales bacterium]
MLRHDPSLARDFEAALAWWHMAGVDCDFADDATAWLSDEPRTRPAPGTETMGPEDHSLRSATRASGEPRLDRNASLPPTPAAAATQRRNLLGDSPPTDLAAFRQWWMEDAALATARGAVRVPPRGGAGAAIMVLVPHPEQGDSDTLLSGPQGRLLANILAAMGVDEGEVYIASALPCHTPMADLEAIAAGGMDAVTAHHVNLVAPARLLAFGTGLSAMLLAPPHQPLREINYAGGKVPAIVSETLEALMESPRLKARFWRRWMEWSATV